MIAESRETAKINMHYLEDIHVYLFILQYSFAVMVGASAKCKLIFA
jgi:hypothetical protein